MLFNTLILNISNTVIKYLLHQRIFLDTYLFLFAFQLLLSQTNGISELIFLEFEITRVDYVSDQILV